jgi:sulfur-carrier protein
MNVLLFARLRDLVGSDRVEVDVPATATIGDLRRQLIGQYPHLAGLLAKSAFAVNDEYADDGAPIPADAEVALLPPVSGG